MRHVFQHILMFCLYVFMCILDNAKYVSDFLSHLYISYIMLMFLLDSRYLKSLVFAFNA